MTERRGGPPPTFVYATAVVVGVAALIGFSSLVTRPGSQSATTQPTVPAASGATRPPVSQPSTDPAAGSAKYGYFAMPMAPGRQSITEPAGLSVSVSVPAGWAHLAAWWGTWAAAGSGGILAVVRPTPVLAGTCFETVNLIQGPAIVADSPLPGPWSDPAPLTPAYFALGGFNGQYVEFTKLGEACHPNRIADLFIPGVGGRGLSASFYLWLLSIDDQPLAIGLYTVEPTEKDLDALREVIESIRVDRT